MPHFGYIAVICCLIVCSLGSEDTDVSPDPKTIAAPAETSPVTPVCIGCRMPQDPNSLKYREMAEEALKVNLRLNNIIYPHHVVQVNSVTLQVVEGYSTRINFTAAPICILAEDRHCEIVWPADLACISETVEQSWQGRTEITVPCERIY